MTTEPGSAKPARGIWGKFIGPMLGGGVVGAGAAYFGMEAIDSGAAGVPSDATIAALGVAMIYAITALAVLIGVVSPKFGAVFLNVEDADELREMKRNLLFSGLAMGLFGLALGIIALASPDSVFQSDTALYISITLLAAGIFAGIHSQRHGDELMREVGRETGNLSYYLSVLVIGGWALLAHLDVVAPPEMLTILTIFWSIVLIAAFWVCGARGMLNRR